MNYKHISHSEIFYYICRNRANCTQWHHTGEKDGAGNQHATLLQKTRTRTKNRDEQVILASFWRMNRWWMNVWENSCSNYNLPTQLVRLYYITSSLPLNVCARWVTIAMLKIVDMIGALWTDRRATEQMEHMWRWWCRKLEHLWLCGSKHRHA